MSLFAINTKGRIQIRGVVQSFKTMDTPHGVWTQMLVYDDRDFSVFGSVPSNILPKVKEGCRVEFVARLNIKTGHYAFFKNPTKAKIL